MTASLTSPVRTASDVPGLRGWEIIREVNHGYFGRVYEAVETGPQQQQHPVHWAMKLIEKRRLNDRQRQNVLNEVNIMRQLAHRNIIRLNNFHDLPNHYVLIMELMLGGDLFERLEKQTAFTEEHAREIIAQVADGIKYLHDRNIAHRDIKIENLMFASQDSREVKIGDFGLAKQLVNTQSTITPCGTKEYMAPEMLEGTQLYSKKVDIWALGCLTYIILFGGFPFYNDQNDRGRTVMSLKDKIHGGHYIFPSGNELGANVSDAARDIIRHCLVVDPARRFSIEQVLAHPWIRTRQNNSPVLHSPAILRETNNFMPLREVFNIGVTWLRDHVNLTAAQPNQATAPNPMNQIHQPVLGPLSPINLEEIQRRREKGKRKMEVIHAQASPLDGAGEEVQPPYGNTTVQPSSTPVFGFDMVADTPAAVSNKKANVRSLSDMQQ